MNAHQPLRLTVCLGSSCFSRGNQRSLEVIQEHLAKRGLADEVELAGHLCEGRCQDGPNLTLEGEVHHAMDATAVVELLDRHFPDPAPWTA